MQKEVEIVLRFSFSKLNQIHKRKGFVFLALAGLSVAVALVIVSLAYFQLDKISKTGLLKISIGTNGNYLRSLGSGINLDSIPSTNYLNDASFEPYAFREAFLVENGTKKILEISNKVAMPGVYASGFFVGANYRVMTEDKVGIVLKKSGKIIKYKPNQIGTFQKAPILGDIPTTSKIKDYTTKGGQSIIVGEKGIIINGINTQSPQVQYVDSVSSDFTGVTNNGNDYFACASDGIVMSSSDGETWTKWKTPGKIKLNAIAASPTAVVSVGDNGILISGFAGNMYFSNIGIEDNIIDIVYGNRQFVAVTNNGNVISSPNGIVWTLRQNKNAVSYKKIEYADSYFLLLTEDGVVQTYKDIGSQPSVSMNLVSGVVDATIMSKSKILALTSKNEIYESTDTGITWEKSNIATPAMATMIGAINDEEILCSSVAVNSYISKLMTEIEVDSELKDGTFQSGDVCYIDIEYPVIPKSYLNSEKLASMKSSWEFIGDGESKKIFSSGSPYDGVGVMEIKSKSGINSPLRYSVISQKINADLTDTALSSSMFYTFSIWVKKGSISESTLKVWISGSFDSIGTEFSNIGTTWKKVTFKFLVPPNLTIGQLTDARINIGTTDEGDFYLDNAYLGLTSENEESFPLQYASQLNLISPAFVRCDFLKMGSSQSMPNRWAINGKLEEALNLVDGSGEKTCPWIVIDSFIGEPELRNFLEYIAGSISSVYGKYRMENGSTLPWISQFDRMMIEFRDLDQNFMSDVSKALYINESIRIIESSPYYNSIKSKIVFVDGMQYSEGIMLSRADYSASDFSLKIDQPRLLTVKKVLSEYSTLIPRSPDRPSNLPLNLMRSAKIDETGISPNLDELVTILLDPIGTDSTLCLLDLDHWATSQFTKVKTGAATIASAASKGEILPVSKTLLVSKDSLVDCYAFRSNGYISLVFASHNDNPVAISVDLPYSFNGASMKRYDAKGEEVEISKLKKSDQKFNIMPKNVILIQITAS